MEKLQLECQIFKIYPSKVLLKFRIFSEKQAEGTVYIRNVTKEPQPIKISNPVTEYFTIDYFVSRGHIFPNKTIELKLKTNKLLEARPYYDTIRIECQKGCKSEIEVAANPDVEGIITIPPEISFGSVPLGETAQNLIRLTASSKPLNFLFIIANGLPGFKIKPMRGTIVNDEVDIKLTYTPMSYITMSIPVHFYLPDIFIEPIYFVVTAITKPGMISDMLIKYCSDKPAEKKFVFPLRPIPPLLTPSTQVTKLDKKMVWGHHYTNLYLLKKEEEKNIEDELIGPLGKYLSEEYEISKYKQEKFMELVKMKKAKEKKVSPSTLEFALGNEWDQEWEEYMELLEPKLMESKELQLIRQRVITYVDETEDFIFPDAPSNIWFLRYQVFSKFVEAARAIIVRKRLKKRLRILKHLRYEDIAKYETSI